MAIGDARGGAIPEFVGETIWDNGNVAQAPNAADRVGLLPTNAAQRGYAGFILTRLAQQWSQWVDFVDPSVIQDLLDLADKIMSIPPVTFVDSSDDPTGTGGFQIAITPDGTTPGQFDIATKHPPYYWSGNPPPDTDTDDDSGLLSKTPTSGNPNHVDTSSAPYGVELEGPNALFAANRSDDGPTEAHTQTSTTPVTNGIAQWQRAVHSDTPFLQVIPSQANDDTAQGPINGYGEVVARDYAALPTASAAHAGAIVRIPSGSNAPDNVFICLYSNVLGWVWVQIGAGSAFGSPTVTTLAAESSATCTMTGSGTTSDPYILHFGIPMGATGATGEAGANGSSGVTPELRVYQGYIQVSYDDGVTWNNLVALSAITGPAGTNFQPPALPGYGGQPLVFWIQILASGTLLPWLIPSNYTIQVLDGSGLWGYTSPDNPDFISDVFGNTDGATSPTALDSRFNLGQVVAEFLDHTGLLVDLDGTHPQSNPLTVLTMTQALYCSLLENVSAGGSGAGLTGNLMVCVKITPAATAGGAHVFNFTVATGNFVDGAWNGVSASVWYNGSGWGTGGSDAGLTCPARQFTTSTTITRIVMSGYVGPGFNLNDSRNSIRIGTNPASASDSVLHIPISGAVTMNGTQFTVDTQVTYPALSAGVTPSDWLELWLYLGNTGATNALYIQHIMIYYSGTDPFA